MSQNNYKILDYGWVCQSERNIPTLYDLDKFCCSLFRKDFGQTNLPKKKLPNLCFVKLSRPWDEIWPVIDTLNLLANQSKIKQPYDLFELILPSRLVAYFKQDIILTFKWFSCDKFKVELQKYKLSILKLFIIVNSPVSHYTIQNKPGPKYLSDIKKQTG
jgi:hypothetical protein